MGIEELVESEAQAQALCMLTQDHGVFARETPAHPGARGTAGLSAVLAHADTPWLCRPTGSDAEKLDFPNI